MTQQSLGVSSLSGLRVRHHVREHTQEHKDHMKALLGTEGPSEGFGPISGSINGSERCLPMEWGSNELLLHNKSSSNLMTLIISHSFCGSGIQERSNSSGLGSHVWGLRRHCSLSTGLPMVSLCRLVWASLQYGSLRAGGLFTWQLKLSGGTLPESKEEAALPLPS